MLQETSVSIGSEQLPVKKDEGFLRMGKFCKVPSTSAASSVPGTKVDAQPISTDKMHKSAKKPHFAP